MRINAVSIFALAIPNWMKWIQTFCFALLYGVWLLPETILIRNICLIIGCLIGLYEIYCFRQLLVKKEAAPVYLIGALFIWVVFHLIFFSSNYELQFREFSSIWKRVLMGAIFALGFGLLFAHSIAKTSKCHQSNQFECPFFVIVYAGLFMPTLIYLIKFFNTNYGFDFHSHTWGYWRICDQELEQYCYIPKTSYVCFCLPLLAIALGGIRENILKGYFFVTSNLIYFMSVIAVLFVFFNENIKNGILYSLIILMIFMGLLFPYARKNLIKKFAVIICALFVCGYFSYSHIKNNDSWSQFFYDFKVAADTRSNIEWMRSSSTYGGPLPKNELNNPVSGTTYERVAWGIVGISLIQENPLGYGLIERSFGALAKSRWPQSNLSQSHSGWIDLTLGIGIPGAFLVILSLIIILFGLIKRLNQTGCVSQWFALWGLLASTLAWFTTELSQKVFFDALVFWVLFSVAINVVAYSNFAVDSSPDV